MKSFSIGASTPPVFSAVPHHIRSKYPDWHYRYAVWRNVPQRCMTPVSVLAVTQTWRPVHLSATLFHPQPAVPVPSGNMLLQLFLLVCTMHAPPVRCCGNSVYVSSTPSFLPHACLCVDIFYGYIHWRHKKLPATQTGSPEARKFFIFYFISLSTWRGSVQIWLPFIFIEPEHQFVCWFSFCTQMDSTT